MIQSVLDDFRPDPLWSYDNQLAKEKEKDKCHTPGQEALLDLVRGESNQGHKPIKAENVPTIDEWAKETDFLGYRAGQDDIE